MSKILIKEGRKVLIFGTFDLLHPGHIYFLNKARSYGDYLIVVIARDRNLLKLKNKQPLFLERERLKMISCLAMVDCAALGDLELGSYAVIRKYNPDVICFGYDQKKLKEDFMRHIFLNNLSIKIHTIKAHKSKRYKSSLLSS